MDDSFNGRCIYCGVICPDMEALQDHMKKCPYKIAREKREENEWSYGKPLTESMKKLLEGTRTWESRSADNEPVDRNCWLYCKDCEQKYKPHKCRVFVRQVLEGEDVSDTIIASPMKIEATDSMDEFMKWFERGDYKFIERDGTTTHKKGD